MTLVLKPPLDLAGLPPPHCTHGPTLLFYGTGFLDANTKKRKERDVAPRFYYACSASRDHSVCNFHCSAHRYQMIRERNPDFLIGQPSGEVEFQYLLDRPKVDFCRKCCRVLVDEPDNASVKWEHQLKNHVACSKVLINYKPSEPWNLITLATENGHQAQYFFTPEMVTYLIKEVIKPGRYDSVLCIGCPTIHHEILHDSTDPRSKVTTSLLLDIDSRFGQFYSRDHFVHFNMFNSYFFETDGRTRLESFLQRSKKLLVLIDPPYGGLVQCLASTLRDILGAKLPPTMLFFPYFNEHWITRAFEGQLKITDFVVTYRNHTKFSRELNSSARIFTNLDRSKLKFVHCNPSMYRWCVKCRRVVFKMNAHCVKCGECSARDTKPHTHCDLCERCVKLTWSHCAKCARCHLPTNRCPTRKNASVDGSSNSNADSNSNSNSN